MRWRRLQRRSTRCRIPWLGHCCERCAPGLRFASTTRAGRTIADSTTGANGNRFGDVYVLARAARRGMRAAKTFANGTSPTQWRVTLDFSSLQGDVDRILTRRSRRIPTDQDSQAAMDLRGGSAGGRVRAQRISGGDFELDGDGNESSLFGGGTGKPADRRSRDRGDVQRSLDGDRAGIFRAGRFTSRRLRATRLRVTYAATQAHTLYLGTRYTTNGALIGRSPWMASRPAPSMWRSRTKTC